MAKNFYIVLGVPRGASSRRIKQAYRDLAKQHHPDMGGAAADPERFRDVQRAYETLGDANRRALYDRDLPRPRRIHPTRNASEIRPKARFRTGSDPRRFQHEEFNPGRSGGTGSLRQGGDGANEVAIEMFLEPSEALQGGLFPLSVPVVAPCERCNAMGSIYSAICSQCLGRAQVQVERRFYIHIPSNVENGATAVLPLDVIGLKGMYLRLFIRVAVMNVF